MNAPSAEWQLSAVLAPIADWPFPPHSDKAAKKNPPTEADGLFSSYYAASRDGPRQQSRKLKRCGHSYLRPSIGAVNRWQQAA